MRPADDIKRFIDKAAVSTRPQADKAVLDTVLTAQKKAIDQVSAPTKPSLRSIVMRSPFTKLAAAAVIAIAAVLFLALWDRSIPSAYALEQTLEANRGIRYLHLKFFAPGQDEPREGWIEFGDDGQARNVRAYMPGWASPVDGPRVIVWKNGTVQMWLQKQNRVVTLKADNPQQELNAMMRELNPRLALARINELKAQGKVEVTIDEPSDKTQPIKVTATYTADSDYPGRRSVLFVDSTTKLLNTMELYQLKDGQYSLKGRIELPEYNQPIDPRMFDLTSQAPADAERYDLGSMDLGLAQGQLSDAEVATAVVRQFFEALIARDYATASRFLPPYGADALQQQYGAVKLLRIVSVGPAAPTGSPSREIVVPCTIEFEENGKTSTATLQGLTVHPLGGQAARWTIQTLGN